jgi:hypothetical protein
LWSTSVDEIDFGATMVDRPRLRCVQWLARGRGESAGIVPTGARADPQPGDEQDAVRVGPHPLEKRREFQVPAPAGIAVRESCLQEILDQFDDRAAIETIAVQRIVGRLTSEQVATLLENIREQALAANETNLAESARLDTEVDMSVCVLLVSRKLPHILIHGNQTGIPERMASSYR